MRETVASGIHEAAGQVQRAAGQVQYAVDRAQGGIGEIRAVIRAQPIVATLVVFALGYVFGRLGSLLPTGRSGHG